MRKQAENPRDLPDDDDATGIANRTGAGTDPEPTPARGTAKERRERDRPGPHARRPNGDHAP